MKRISTLLIVFMMSATMFAQGPAKMSYQSVVRGASGNLIASSTISIKISILQGGINGTPVYVEEQSPSTNNNGLATIVIGNGSVITGNLSTINWSNGPYFIKTETDPTGNSNYTISSTSELLSVPYAMYADKAGNAGATSVNHIQQVNGNITIDKSDLGLGNVDNTSDLDKPVSIATQDAIDQKADIHSPDFTGTPTVPTAANGSNNGQIASTAFVTNAVANAVPDATATDKGKIALGGDLAGNGSTAEAPVISDNAINTAKVADDAITGSKIINGSITTDKIQDDNITTSKIADDNITTAKIADANVTSAKVADAAITYAKIQEVTSGTVLGRASLTNGSVEEISTTGDGNIVRADSPIFTGQPQAPAPSQGSNDHQIATTEFVKQTVSANNIRQPESGWPIILSDADAGKIITTQWGAWPLIPDNLTPGFSCTIINYSNSDFTSNALINAYFFSPATGWNNGVGTPTFGIKSGGTVKLTVIDVNGVLGYFVTGDLL